MQYNNQIFTKGYLSGFEKKIIINFMLRQAWAGAAERTAEEEMRERTEEKKSFKKQN